MGAGYDTDLVHLQVHILHFTFYINKTKRREEIFTLNTDDRDSKRDSPDR